jgi:alkylated DNA repair dioxygenase AlkB
MRLPEGFQYRSDFIALDEERHLASSLSSFDFKPFEFRGYTGRRRVVSFGLRYDFSEGRLFEAAPMPPFLLSLKARAALLFGIEPDAINHALVTEYPPGAPIGWHKDRFVFGDVIGVSLLAPCTFRLRRRMGAKWERFAIVLEPRSAYLLQGPSRTEWEHSIPAVEAQRYSITFRTLAAARVWSDQDVEGEAE